MTEGRALLPLRDEERERRAYPTLDYGHDNLGTLVDVDVAAGALSTQSTSLPARKSHVDGVLPNAMSRDRIRILPSSGCSRKFEVSNRNSDISQIREKETASTGRSPSSLCPGR